MSANGTVFKPFTLRLDDGSVITVAKDGESSKKITRLSGEEAVKAGKLGPEHVQKLHLLVYKLECLAKGDSWVEGDAMIAFEAKRKADFGLVRCSSVCHACWASNTNTGGPRFEACAFCRTGRQRPCRLASTRCVSATTTPHPPSALSVGSLWRLVAAP